METTHSLEAPALFATGDRRLDTSCAWMARACQSGLGDRVDLAESIDDLDAEAWDTVVSQRGLYFQRAYLRGVEAGAKGDVEHRYAVFTRDGRPRGVACFQIARFVGPSLAPILGGCSATRAAAWVAGLDGDALSAPVLVCGSTFNCAETGFAFTPEVGPREASYLISTAIRRILAEQPFHRRSLGVLFKEFGSRANPVAAELPRGGYTEISSGPKMVLELDEAWSSWDDYLRALKSKFRVKAKRAYSKSARLEVRDLSAEDLWEHRTRMRTLLAGVVDNATYRLGAIDIDSLHALRSSLDDEMVVRGYFLEGELVGFLTGFVVGDTLDAHVVGIDYDENHAHAIYPRLLCDYLRIALERGLARVDYGRTAEEIKSTLGASPVPTRCYLRHNNLVLNPLVGLVTRNIDLPTPTLRHPFKASVVASRRAA